jgi:hypothetical protein
MKTNMKKEAKKSKKKQKQINENKNEKRKKRKTPKKTKKRKGFEKKRLLIISKVNFECKGGNIAKRKKNTMKENEKGSRKSSF